VGRGGINFSQRGGAAQIKERELRVFYWLGVRLCGREKKKKGARAWLGLERSGISLSGVGGGCEELNGGRKNTGDGEELRLRFISRREVVIISDF